MLLIDDRTPPPASPPERPVSDPDWKVVAWVAAAVASGVGAAFTGGFVSVGLAFCALACAAHAAALALPYGGGLREHRQ